MLCSMCVYQSPYVYYLISGYPCVDFSLKVKPISNNNNTNNNNTTTTTTTTDK